MGLELYHIVILLVFLTNSIAAIITVFMEERDISVTWAWLLVLTLLPVAGFVLYLFLGRRLRKTRLFEIKPHATTEMRESMSIQARQLEVAPYKILANSPYLKDLAYLFLQNDQAILSQDNQLDLYTEGEVLFDQILADLKSAKKHIHLLYYTFEMDEAGRKLLKTLEDKAAEGVEVLVVFDALGSRKTLNHHFKKLRANGGSAISFFGSKIPLINLRMNYRNHRKIIVVDGQVGFVGGFNIGDTYLSKGPLGYWRDTHLRINGDAVRTLQSRFISDWNAVVKTDEKLLLKRDYYPLDVEYCPAAYSNYSQNNILMQIVSNGPDTNYHKIKMGLMRMIGTAQHSIYIQTPYFIPDESTFELLSVAALSGVDVRVMIPCKPDHPVVYRVTEYWSKVALKHNIKIYRYDKNDGFLHAKMVLVDGKVATIGTTNIDVRSFKLNFEINAFIYDHVFIRKLYDVFEHDQQDCSRLTMAYFDSQSLFKRFKQTLFRLFSPIL